MGINQLGFGIKPAGRVDKNGLTMHNIIDLATGKPLVLHKRHMSAEQAATVIEEYVMQNLAKLNSMRKEVIL